MNKIFQFKLVLLGQAGVGKSNLVLRFVKGEFHENNESTIGAAFLTQTVTLSDQSTVKFEIWDTAGQERFNSLAPMYYRGAQAALVVYDITNELVRHPYEPVVPSLRGRGVALETTCPHALGSLSRAKAWVKELQTQGVPKMVIALVGNKSDLESLRRIKTEDAQNYAEDNGILFMETSAKTCQNVKEIFEAIAKTLPKDRDRKPDGRPLIVPQADDVVPQKKSCCS